MLKVAGSQGGVSWRQKGLFLGSSQRERWFKHEVFWGTLVFQTIQSARAYYPYFLYLAVAWVLLMERGALSLSSRAEGVRERVPVCFLSLSLPAQAVKFPGSRGASPGWEAAAFCAEQCLCCPLPTKCCFPDSWRDFRGRFQMGKAAARFRKKT